GRTSCPSPQHMVPVVMSRCEPFLLLRRWWAGALVTILLTAAWARTGHAALVALEIHRRDPFAGGTSFGQTGPYEKLVGVARFAVDPTHLRNRAIVDLGLAPRNARGQVEFEADIFILAPKDPTRGNGAILYDVNNRGNKLALGFFNNGGGNDPTRL